MSKDAIETTMSHMPWGETRSKDPHGLIDDGTVKSSNSALPTKPFHPLSGTPSNAISGPLTVPNMKVKK